MKCRTCGTTLTEGALLCGECGTSALAPAPTLGDTARYDRRALRRSLAAQAAQAGRAVGLPAPETETAAYSLAFSTGETVRVSGRGLVGRNPTPSEGESFDYLVQIVDPERSMSKTHLEFGIDDDGFWILDRGSANGTRIVEGHDVVDLEPGLRVVIYRGLRVELGDQYFDLH